MMAVWGRNSPELLKAANWLLVAAIIAVAVLSLALTVFATPLADDFCRGGLPTNWSAALDKVSSTYFSWTGRWGAMTVYSLTFPHIPLTTAAYPALLALSGPIWFTIFYIGLHILYGNTISSARKALFAAVLCAVYWVGMPHPGDTWYWLTGSVEYQVPMLLFALTMLVLTSSWIVTGGHGRRAAATVLGACLGFLVTGFNELCGLWLLGTLSVAAFLAFVRRRSHLAAIHILAGAAVAAGLVINLAAPGNAIRRASDFPDANDLVFAIKSLIVPGLHSPIEWLCDARLFALSLMLLTSRAFVSKQPEWTGWKLPLPGLLSSMSVFVPLVGFSAVLAGQLAVSYAQGYRAPPRVQNVLYFMFVISWTASLIPLGRLVETEDERQGKFAHGVRTIAAIVFPIALLAAPNTLNAVYGLPKIASRWHPANVSRDAEIRRRMLKGDQNIVVAAFEFMPQLYLGGAGDITDDPSDWRNRCLAQYYGVQTIVTTFRDGARERRKHQ
jgi:hypothetical protein